MLQAGQERPRARCPHTVCRACADSERNVLGIAVGVKYLDHRGHAEQESATSPNCHPIGWRDRTIFTERRNQSLSLLKRVFRSVGDNPDRTCGGGRLLCCVAAAVLVSWCGTVVLAADWDEVQWQAYGGEYAVDCADASSIRLQVGRESLVLQRGSRRVERRHIDSALTFFGQSPPPEFQIALMGQSPGPEFVAVMFRDRNGRYAMFDLEPAVSAELRVHPDPKTRYRDCDAVRRERDGAAFLRQQRLDAEAERAAARASPLADARFRRAYRLALGARVSQRWLDEMVGPMPAVESIELAGTRYSKYAVCKPHDCYDHNIVVLYDAAAGQAYAALFEEGEGLLLLNSPPAALALELPRLWRKEWRQGQ